MLGVGNKICFNIPWDQNDRNWECVHQTKHDIFSSEGAASANVFVDSHMRRRNTSINWRRDSLRNVDTNRFLCSVKLIQTMCNRKDHILTKLEKARIDDMMKQMNRVTSKRVGLTQMAKNWSARSIHSKLQSHGKTMDSEE